MKQILQTILLTAVMIGLSACSVNEGKDPVFDDDVTVDIKDKDELPEWLSDYIDYLEYIPNGHEITDSKSGIYRFEWHGETFYEVYSPTQSMIHQEVYKADGTPVQIAEALNEGTRNWTIVYLFHPTSKKPGQIHYPVNIQDEETCLFFRNAFLSTDAHGGFYFPNSVDQYAACYIVNSVQQLQLIYDGVTALPSIDFDKYTLIIGRLIVLEKSQMVRQSLTTDGTMPVLQLYYEAKEKYTPDGQNITNDANSASISYFWALYPKQTADNLTLKLITNNQGKDATTYSWDEPIVPLQKHYYLTDWESADHHLTTISQSDFNSCAIEHGWKIIGKHEIYDDGSVQIDDYRMNLTGGGPVSYEFGEGYLKTFFFYDATPANAYYKTPMHYVEESNMIYLNDSPTFQVLSISDEEMVVVERTYIVGGKYGKGKYAFFYIVLKRLSDAKLEEIREDYWVAASDLDREMTKEDLYHTWVLTTYYDRDGTGWKPHHLNSSRKNPYYTIRFLPDGTVEGKSGTAQFKGTYEYDGKLTMKITPQGTWPSYFADFELVNTAEIHFASWLFLNSKYKRSYTLVRSKED